MRLRDGRLLLMEIGQPRPSHVAAVEALLTAAGLPIEGAAEALPDGVVAIDGGAVVAAAGIERFGSAGLLRSVVVAEYRRGAGLGRAIVAAAEERARGLGLDELFLLTESATAWFPRLGYEPIARSEATAVVGESIEFTTICRDTGIAMRKRIG
jgi:amino-acid N-acetyltransferase